MNPESTDIAILAAGCFWSVEEKFRTTEGVLNTKVGYTGGNTQDPTYEDVCSGSTEHAEAVWVEFDTTIITYKDILEMFFKLHDPTTPNRQGFDIGSQYRSAIFFRSPEQESEAKQVVEELKSTFSSPITTQIAHSSDFYDAEDYHQQYLKKRGANVCGG